MVTHAGLAAKNFIDVGAGVVDSDYRGELKVSEKKRRITVTVDR